jgi:hypothetical protein
MQDLMTTVQLNEGQSAFTIIQDFTTQADVDSEKLCLFIKGIVDWASKLVQNMNSLGWGFIPKTDNGDPKFPNLGGVVNSALDLVEMMGRLGADLNMMDAQETWKNTQSQHAEGELIMDQSYVDGICGAIGGEMKNENLERTTQMLMHIKKIFEDVRRNLEKSLTETMKGDLSRGSPSRLAYYMGNFELIDIHNRLKEHMTVFTA